jgi:hypothetical protein
LPQGRPSADSALPFFKALRRLVVEAWTSPEGYAYDQVIYAVGYPYRPGDLERVLAFAGRSHEARLFPPLAALNRLLTDSGYPELAGEAPSGVSAESWSAVLHFLDPSYPLATRGAAAALRAMGERLPEEVTASSYPAYVASVDRLKEQAPVWAVPETNWYLARVIEVGLGAFLGAQPGAARRPAAAARA